MAQNHTENLSLLHHPSGALGAISLYPVLRKRSEGLALGAVIFRALEAGNALAAYVIRKLHSAWNTRNLRAARNRGTLS